jgi:hypothetical protein
MNGWISVFEKMPRKQSHVWFVRLHGDNPITVSGHWTGSAWYDKSIQKEIAEEQVLWWQYLEVPKAPPIGAPFRVVCYVAKDSEISFKLTCGDFCHSPTIKEENTAYKLREWLNELWNEHHEKVQNV